MCKHVTSNLVLSLTKAALVGPIQDKNECVFISAPASGVTSYQPCTVTHGATAFWLNVSEKHIFPVIQLNRPYTLQEARTGKGTGSLRESQEEKTHWDMTWLGKGRKTEGSWRGSWCRLGKRHSIWVKPASSTTQAAFSALEAGMWCITLVHTAWELCRAEATLRVSSSECIWTNLNTQLY